MKYGYYPGCSLSSTGLELDISTKAVARKAGLDLMEIPDWNCCGASSAHLEDHNLAVALPARNLAIAEEAGLPLAIPCAACFLRCKSAEKAVRDSEETRQKVEYIIGREYEAKYDAKGLLEVVLSELGLDGLKANTIHSLEGLKVAAYYGCYLVRPPEVTQFDDPEDPHSMDDIVTALGGTPVDWNYKVECCGASFPTARKMLGMDMTQSILDEAQRAGADCIICSCPLCLTNLGMRQRQIGKKQRKEYGQKEIPIFYFTELIGLAMGLSPKELGLSHHFVDPMAMLRQKGIVKGGN